MPVFAIVRQNEIGLANVFQVFEELLDLAADVRKEAIAKRLHQDFFALRLGEKAIGAFDRLCTALSAGAQHHPMHLCFGNFFEQTQDRPATANFDVVAVRAEAKKLEPALLAPCKRHAEHRLTLPY
jgi:hypothetical protein